MVTRMRPSCGRIRSAMSMPASTLSREVIPSDTDRGRTALSIRSPSTRTRMRVFSASGSMWMSVAPMRAEVDVGDAVLRRQHVAQDRFGHVAAVEQDPPQPLPRAPLLGEGFLELRLGHVPGRDQHLADLLPLGADAVPRLAVRARVAGEAAKPDQGPQFSLDFGDRRGQLR